MQSPLYRYWWVSAAALLLLGPPPAGAQSARSGTERGYLAGRRLLDAAIRATGDSAALAQLGTLATSFCARAVEIGQSAAPDAPYDTISAVGQRIYDLARHRYAQDWSTEFRGGIPLALHETVTDSAAYSTDLRGGVVFLVAPSGLSASQRRVEDNAPYAPLILLDRARRNAATLRLVRGGSGIPGTDAALFSDRGFLLTLSFDRSTHLLVSADALVDNWEVGLAPLRFQFRDYRRVGSVRLAGRVTTWFRGGLLTDVTFPDLVRTGTTPANVFPPAVPTPDSRLPTLTDTITVGGQPSITIDTVAPHVFAVRYGQTAGPNFGYNPPFAYVQLLVELKDRLLLVDTPWYPSVQQSAIGTMRTLFPGKPVGVVSFTHYHSDHLGGLRPYIEAGATFVTTPGNRRLIARVARTAHPSDAHQPALVPKIETFTGSRTIDDPAAPVELHEIGGAHADEMVVAWLPRQQVLFTADLFGIFPARGGPGGRYEQERSLARYVREQGWKVQKLVSGHGAISDGAELERALESAPAATVGSRVPVPACR
jgi:glyoxylase-like metal-dependent hydrolase (beta-lactamase superfamily II)